MIRRMPWCAWSLLAVLSGCGPLLVSPDDAVVTNGRPVPLVAHVSREHVYGLRSDVRGARVEFFLNGQGIGQGITGPLGRAAAIPDDLSGDPPAFRVAARAGGKTVDATGRIFYWRTGRPVIAVDIDHTISQTNIKQLIARGQVDGSDPVPGSSEVLTDLASDYYILYLTARPRFLIDKTREWLHRYGFPPGPVVLSVRIRDLLHPFGYKHRALENLRRQWPDLRIGIGNRYSDLEAYGASGMLPVILYQGPEQRQSWGAVGVRDWASLRRFFQANHEVLTDGDQLQEVIAGRRMVLQPLIPYTAKGSRS